MLYSKLLIPTLREDPGEAEVISHRLMLRAGMIRKVASGIYTYLPLAYRVIKKIERIIRDEMDRAGAQEVLLPLILPAELWRETGRWDKYGKELLRLKDRNERDFCVGPTHEEVITDLIRREVKSYRQLPLNLYQIQIKFRDEIRPRFGLMRAREFIMKDAYSFDIDENGAERSYMMMFKAYNAIFSRCGLNFRPVEAETGLIGGRFSHEFMVFADTGEEAIIVCDSCEYAANIEKANGIDKKADKIRQISTGDLLPLEKRVTPGKKSVEDVAAYLGVEPYRLVKTLMISDGDRVVAALIRGDHELNEAKLMGLLNVSEIRFLSPAEIEEITGAPSGFSGPVGLKDVYIIADSAIKDMTNFIVGGNEKDIHLININFKRDFYPDQFADIRKAADGDRCPGCLNGELHIVRGIEVGHTFKLGTKYSEAMEAVYLDEEGRKRYVIMGCYGIGVGRTMAAAIEQNHDRFGIIWPSSIAPFETIILPLNMDSDRVVDTARTIYKSFLDKGKDALLDDRDERAGVKFKDADLIGIPHQVIVGEKGLSKGIIEIKERATGEKKEVKVESLLSIN